MAAALLQPRYRALLLADGRHLCDVLSGQTDPRGALGLGGKDERLVGTVGSYLTAIDYRTGKIAWQRRFRTTATTRDLG